MTTGFAKKMSDAVSEAQLSLLKVMFPAIDLGPRPLPCRDLLKVKLGSARVQDEGPVSSLPKE